MLVVHQQGVCQINKSANVAKNDGTPHEWSVLIHLIQALKLKYLVESGAVPPCLEITSIIIALLKLLIDVKANDKHEFLTIHHLAVNHNSIAVGLINRKYHVVNALKYPVQTVVSLSVGHQINQPIALLNHLPNATIN